MVLLLKRRNLSSREVTALAACTRHDYRGCLLDNTNELLLKEAGVLAVLALFDEIVCTSVGCCFSSLEALYRYPRRFESLGEVF